MKKAFLLLSAVTLLAGCATGGVSRKTYESIDGNVEVVSSAFYYKPPILAGYSDTISVEQIKRRGIVYYKIEIEYWGPHWRFMSGRLLIEADGEVFRYEDNAPRRNVSSGYSSVSVREVISSIVPREVLQKMAAASVLRIEFHGSPVTVNEKGKAALVRFLDATS